MKHPQLVNLVDYDITISYLITTLYDLVVSEDHRRPSAIAQESEYAVETMVLEKKANVVEL